MLWPELNKAVDLGSLKQRPSLKIDLLYVLLTSNTNIKICQVLPRVESPRSFFLWQSLALRFQPSDKNLLYLASHWWISSFMQHGELLEVVKAQLRPVLELGNSMTQEESIAFRTSLQSMLAKTSGPFSVVLDNSEFPDLFKEVEEELNAAKRPFVIVYAGQPEQARHFAVSWPSVIITTLLESIATLILPLTLQVLTKHPEVNLCIAIMV